MRRNRLALLAPATALTLVPPAGALAAVHHVSVDAMTFNPAVVNVSPGDRVHWTLGSGSHTVTSGTGCTYDGIFFDAPVNPLETEFEWTVPYGVSSVPYFCRFHCFFGMTGQINVSTTPINFEITLDANQESGVTSSATGAGTAVYDPATRLFSWDISFSGLSSAQTSAHFHGAAPACQTASVQVPLPTGSPIVGSATLSAQQGRDLVAGLWYVNIHTTNFSSGEIRGQVVPAGVPDPIPDPIQPGAVVVDLEPLATGLTAPNWGAVAPGDPDRLFVTDQNGTLWAINVDTGAKSVFLDVSSMLVPLGIVGPGSFDERGLLGVAFHPDYPSNGLLYTYTSEPIGNPPDFSTIPIGSTANCQSVIREWAVPNPGDPNSVVDPLSSRVLMRVDKPQFNHNAGCVVFGADGYLYISFGDGGAADDRDDGAILGVPNVGHGCEGNGQNINSILGKIVRIDVNGSNSANGQYGIPATNPFVGVTGLDEIYAYGFRNPFRFSFDEVTGQLYVADVGQNDLEEVNTVGLGDNCGWRLKEGSMYFSFNGINAGYVTDIPQTVPSDLVDPIAQYDHDEGIAIVGGFVYRGQRLPQLAGKYVCGDFARTFSNDGRLFYLDTEIVELTLFGGAPFGRSLLGFGQDASGDIYVLANSTGTPFGSTGEVLRIRLFPGDTDADGDVDIADLSALLTLFGLCEGDTGYDASIDFDRSGCIDLADLSELLTNFGL